MTKFNESAGGAYDSALYAAVGTVRVLPGPLSSLERIHAAPYRRGGFLAMESTLPPAMVDDALGSIDDLISGSGPEFRGIQWEGGACEALTSSTLEERRDLVRKLFRFTEHEARLRAVAEPRPIVEATAFLLGTDCPALFADQALLGPRHRAKEALASGPGVLRPAARSPVIGLWMR